MNSINKVIVAAAGSGKTTYLVDEALKVRNSNVLTTTYTEYNEAEIRQKILENNQKQNSENAINTQVVLFQIFAKP